MFFDDSRPDRRKRANRGISTDEKLRQLENSPVPPAKSYELLTDAELWHGGDRTFIYDVESYHNYFLIAFKCTRTGKVVLFEDSPVSKIDTIKLGFILYRFRIIGFNSRRYDLPMCLLALQGADAAKLKQCSDEIIYEELQAYEVERRYNLRPVNINHIDLIEVAPLKASLKIYAGRLHCPRMQDLPYRHNAILQEFEAINVRDYCVNDLDNTELLFNELAPHIELREKLGNEYGSDLRSKSDAQLAQIIVNTELERVTGEAPKPAENWVGRKFHYEAPAYVKFASTNLNEALKDILNSEITVGGNGHVICPSSIEGKIVTIGGNNYKIGMGGLHSQEKSVSYYSTNDTLIIDRDVTGYYPNLILKNGFYPKHIGPDFLAALQNIVDRRYRAKKMGIAVTADSLKIASNGIFGKLSDPYSTVYDPSMMVQTTLTGQLSLLMAIEQIELAGFKVVSANTDGIVILCPRARHGDLNAIFAMWENITGLETEETRYRSIHSRDVNNYIAVKEDASCKSKGVYCERGSALNSVLSKNPESLICSDALQAFLARGVPVADTIRASQDVRRFVTVRTVKGGAAKSGVLLGKAVRWYYAEGEQGEINYVLSGNKVPKSEGARPLMELPGHLPHDLDFDRYVSEAVEMLYDVGVYKKAGTPKLL